MKKINYAVIDISTEVDEAAEACQLRKVWIAPLMSDGILQSTIQNNSDELLKSTLQILLRNDINYVFVCNGAQFFGYLDYWAETHNLPDYAAIKAQDNRRITVECYNKQDSEANVYSRKLWLYSKNFNRHTVLKSVTFLNFSALTGGRTIADNARIFDITPTLYTIGVQTFRDIVLKFDKLYFELTGLEFLTERGASAWTAGGMAKKYYLTLKGQTLTQYQNSHKKNIKFEYDMRLKGLLPAGLMYVKDTNLHIAQEANYIRKFDKNSLFAYVMCKYNNDLSGFIKCTEKDYAKHIYSKHRDENKVFILDIKYALFRLREGRPHILQNEFELCTGAKGNQYFEIKNQALFDRYFQVLQDYYTLLDLELETVYYATARPDDALKKYISTLYAAKTTYRENREIDKSNFVKLLLNNLHGKFAQKTISSPFTYVMENNALKKVYSSEIIDEWEKKRFHFERGAYIYTLARVEMIREILYLEKKYTPAIWEKIYYIDTDCIITDADIQLDIGLGLGQYKIEHEYQFFSALVPAGKAYYGIYNWGLVDLVVAGIDVKQIHKQIPLFSNFLYFDEYIKLSEHTYTVKVLKRLKGGTDYVTIRRALVGTGECGDGLL